MESVVSGMGGVRTTYVGPSSPTRTVVFSSPFPPMDPHVRTTPVPVWGRSDSEGFTRTVRVEGWGGRCPLYGGGSTVGAVG